MMRPEILETTIDGLLDRSPFHPFTLVMNDGVELEVDHPKAVHFLREFGIFYGSGGLPQFFEAASVNRVSADLAEGEDARAKAA